MKYISDVVSFMSQRAPFQMAEKWDNVGLLVGDGAAKLNKIVAGIELSGEMIESAIKTQSNLIITHHPIFFKGAKCLDFSQKESEAAWVRTLIKNDISLLSMHTNFDRAPNALHSYLFNQLGINNCRPLENLAEREASRFPEGAGYGIQGDLNEPMNIESFIPKVKEVFDVPGIRLSGNRKANIKRVGFVSGTGMFLWQQALREGVDLYISGDVKHHEALDAVNAGLNVLDVGHFGAEKHFASVVKDWLSGENVSVETFVGDDPFQYFV